MILLCMGNWSLGWETTQRVLILIDQEFSFSYLNVYIRKIDRVAVAVIHPTASYYLKTHPAFQTLPVQYFIIVYHTRIETSFNSSNSFLSHGQDMPLFHLDFIIQPGVLRPYTKISPDSVLSTSARAAREPAAVAFWGAFFGNSTSASRSAANAALP